MPQWNDSLTIPFVEIISLGIYVSQTARHRCHRLQVLSKKAHYRLVGFRLTSFPSLLLQLNCSSSFCDQISVVVSGFEMYKMDFVVFSEVRVAAIYRKASKTSLADPHALMVLHAPYSY